MKIINIILLGLLLHSCKPVDGFSEFPDLDFDPLQQAYQKNRIKSYSTVLYGTDYEGTPFSFKSDSVILDRKGRKVGIYELTDMVGGTTYLMKYDSLNRVAEQEVNSCLSYNYFFVYSLEPTLNQVTKNMYKYEEEDTVLHLSFVYSYNDTFDRIKSVIEMRKETSDTLDISIYEYKGEKIKSIEGSRHNLFYTYNVAGNLVSVRKTWSEIFDRPEEMHYISLKTGLIDSTSLGDYGVYKYAYNYW